jgi:sialate O-acetylesterase
MGTSLKPTSRPVVWAAALACLLSSVPAAAEVRLAGLFGDHMVLQTGRRLPVWGWAAPGE